MEAKIKIFVTLIITTFLFSSTLLAQFCGPYGGNRFELQTTAIDPYISFTVGTGACGGAGALTLPGIGVNNRTPSYMLDILCTPSTNRDVNISCPTCTPVNSVGYRIGDSMVLWYNNSMTNLYCGVGAGTNSVLGLALNN